MKNILAIALTISLFVSCAKKDQEKTQAKLMLLGSSVATKLGGVMIYGSNGAHKVAISFGNEAESKEILLPNGIWNFIAVSWDGPNVFEGQSKCGVTSGIDLNGEDATVDLSLNKFECDKAFFGDDVTRVTNFQFSKLIPADCSNITNPNIKLNTAGILEECRKSSATSYKIFLPSIKIGPNYKNFDLSKSLSRCIDDTTNSDPLFYSSTQEVRIPAFSKISDIAIPIIIKSYSGSGCNGVEQTYVLGNGLHGSYPGQAKVFFTGMENIVAMGRNVCHGANTSITKYLSSEAIAAPGFNPICNREQIKNIANNIAYNKDKNFILASDINFFGVNDFVPIGDATNPYMGTFDGNGKTIRNLNYTNSAVQKKGFFGALASSTIKDINIDNFNFNYSDGNNLGLFVGYSAYGDLQNIKIKNSSLNILISTDVSSNSSYGMLAGNLLSYNTSNIEILNSSMTVDSSKGSNANKTQAIGLFIGKSDTNVTGSFISLNKFKSVDSSLTLNVSGANDDYSKVGGVIGYMVGHTSGFEIREILSENLSLTAYNAINVGGVAGQTEYGRIISAKSIDSSIEYKANSYSPNTVGGVIGLLGSGSVLGNVYNNTNITSFGNYNTIGGLIGKISAVSSQIMNVKYSGKLQDPGNSSGGIIGSISSGTSSLVMENLIFEGEIETNNSVTYLGGVIGKGQGSFYLSKCASKGKIKTHASIGDVGGISGYNTGILNNCYFDGELELLGLINNEVGGIVSTNLGQIKNSYGYGIHNYSCNTNCSTDIGLDSTGNYVNCYSSTNNSITSSQCSNKVIGNSAGESGDQSIYVGLKFKNAPISGTISAAQGSNSISGTGTNFTTELNLLDTIITTDNTKFTVFNIASGTILSAKALSLVAIPSTSISHYGSWYWDSNSNTPKLKMEQYTNTFGNGVMGDTYSPVPISSPQDWNFIASQMDKGAMILTYRLTADLDFNDVGGNLEPWGDPNTLFTGTLLGNGKTISNATINKPTDSYLGIISRLGANARIKDRIANSHYTRSLTLDNINTTGDSSVGILTGRITDNTTHPIEIENVRVINSTVNANSEVGGVIGSIDLQNGNSKIKYINSDVDVVAIGSNSGGVIGEVVSSSAAIEYSFLGFTGTNNSPSANNVGGIFGSFSPAGKIKNVGSIGNVSGNNYVGGVIGDFSNGALESCFSKNNTILANDFAGGIVGGSNIGVIDGCYSKSYITTSGGGSYAGGLIGFSNNAGGSVYNSYTNNPSIISPNADSFVKGVTPSISTSYANNASASTAQTVTPENMKNMSNMPNLNFERVYTIEEGVSSPTLKSESKILNGLYDW
jgi:hypothetical protein